MRALRTLTCAVLLAAAPGCIYRHTVEPLDVNLNATRVWLGEREGRSEMMRVSVDGFRAQWGDMSAEKAARDGGLATIEYADIEEWSILGIFTDTKLHLYGRPLSVDSATAQSGMRNQNSDMNGSPSASRPPPSSPQSGP